MSPLQPGAEAPAIPAIDLQEPRAVWFHKVTCPVCQLAAPVAQRLEDAYAGRVVGVGQDPTERLEEFSGEFGMTFPVLQEDPPYPASKAYGITVVPTLVLVQGGRIDDVVESWDRAGYNRVAVRLSELTGSEPTTLSDPADGLPSFRPG
jgi:thiol-disulfide isomerase/thioredoxin